jgi:hypothetical protein
MYCKKVVYSWATAVQEGLLVHRRFNCRAMGVTISYDTNVNKQTQLVLSPEFVAG